METIISFALLLVFLLVLTISRIKGLTVLTFIFKTTSSLLFLAVAHFARKECQKENKTTYFKLMFLGLFFSLLGDVFLVIKGLDIFFILGVFSFACAMVLFMTPGLAFFYGGLVRRKNVLNTMMSSFFIMGLSAALWVVVGYSLSFGNDHFSIIGNLKWFC